MITFIAETLKSVTLFAHRKFKFFVYKDVKEERSKIILNVSDWESVINAIYCAADKLQPLKNKYGKKL